MGKCLTNRKIMKELLPIGIPGKLKVEVMEKIKRILRKVKAI